MNTWSMYLCKGKKWCGEPKKKFKKMFKNDNPQSEKRKIPNGHIPCIPHI